MVRGPVLPRSHLEGKKTVRGPNLPRSCLEGEKMARGPVLPRCAYIYAGNWVRSDGRL